MAFLRAIGTFFKYIWYALDGLRKVLHLVLLLLIFGVIVAAASRDLPIVPREAALVLAPEGRLVEERSGAPFERVLAEATGDAEAETRVRDLVDVLRAAREDDRIKAVVLDLSKMSGGGLPALQDLAAEIAAVRKAGKRVLAWGEYLDQRQYYLAAQADEVYIDPFGGVILQGYAYFRTYYKGTLDKLGVKVHVFKVGTHKSAPDTWIRTNMSPEDREEAQGWVGALWTAYKTDVATARGIEPDALQAYADKAGEGVREFAGDTAQYAQSRGLVNGLKTREQFEDAVSGLAGMDEDEHSYNSVDWRQYLSVVRSEAALHKKADRNVAVIVASGEIMDGEQPPGTVGGDTLAALLRDARFDDEIKAVVLRIDSPGGSMMASEVVRREVVALKAVGKPVVASMASVAASGGYYIAMDADRILAAPSTITGSIGVFAVLPTFEDTLGKVGVTTDCFGTTKLAGAEHIERGLNPELGSILQSSVENAYQRFVGAAAKARDRKVEEIDSIAQGKVWSGKDAKAAGLIDDFGNVDDAIRIAAELASLGPHHGTRWVEQSSDWRDALALKMGATAARFVAWTGFAPLEPPIPGAALLRAEVKHLERMRALQGRPLYFCGCEPW